MLHPAYGGPARTDLKTPPKDGTAGGGQGTNEGTAGGGQGTKTGRLPLGRKGNICILLRIYMYPPHIYAEEVAVGTERYEVLVQSITLLGTKYYSTQY